MNRMLYVTEYKECYIEAAGAPHRPLLPVFFYSFSCQAGDNMGSVPQVDKTAKQPPKLQESRFYGYARLLPREHRSSAQHDALLQAGVSDGMIYTDRVSSSGSGSPALRRLLKKLRPGDVLFVTELSRLGSNYDEITDCWRTVTKDLNCDMVVLDTPLLDTRRGNDVSELVLQIFRSFDEIGSSWRRQRQAEGIAVAKANDVAFGRPAKTRPENFDYIAGLYDRRLVSSRDAAERLDVSQKTFLKWFHETHCA